MKLRGKNLSSVSSASGITIAEVMVAVLILATIAIAFYGALSSGFAVVQSTREDLRAAQILNQKVEAIRLCTWSQLTNFNFQETYDPLATTNQSRGVVYTGTVSNSPAAYIPNTSSYYNNISLITVTVGWTNYSSRVPIAHIRQMQTQVARYGLQNYIWGATE